MPGAGPPLQQQVIESEALYGCRPCGIPPDIPPEFSATPGVRGWGCSIWGPSPDSSVRMGRPSAQTQRAHTRARDNAAHRSSSGPPLRLEPASKVLRAPCLAFDRLWSRGLSAVPCAPPVWECQCSAWSAGDTAGIAQPVIVARVVGRDSAPGRAWGRGQLIAQERRCREAPHPQQVQIVPQIIGQTVVHDNAPIHQPGCSRTIAGESVRLGPAPLHQHARMTGQRLRSGLRRQRSLAGHRCVASVASSPSSARAAQ